MMRGIEIQGTVVQQVVRENKNFYDVYAVRGMEKGEEKEECHQSER